MKECSLEALTLQHDQPLDFFRIVCQKSERPSRLLIVFRVFTVLYSYAILIWIICLLFIAPKLKLHLSYCTWVQILWSASTEFGLMKTFKGIKQYDPEDYTTGLTWYVKTYWVLFSMVLPAAVLSFIVVLSQMSLDDLDVIYIFIGMITPFLTLVEFDIIAFPLRIINFFYFLLHSLLYIIFTVIYHAAGGHGIDGKPFIYKDLDWRDPKHACLAAFIALLIGEAAYVIFWGWSRLKLSKWCCGKEPPN